MVKKMIQSYEQGMSARSNPSQAGSLTGIVPGCGSRRAGGAVLCSEALCFRHRPYNRGTKHKKEMPAMSNIWHDISPDRIQPEDFVAVIEIPKGSK